MRYETAFDVAGDPAEVMDTFADLPTVAAFLPGASVGPANEEGRHPGTLVVSFGPKKLAFKGTVANAVDRASLSGTVSGTAAADVRGAMMAVTMQYRLEPGAAGGTRVSLVSDAELAGMLAEFAKTGGVVLANAVLADFAKRLGAHFEARAIERAAASIAVSEAPAEPAEAPAATPGAPPAAVLAGTSSAPAAAAAPATPATLSVATLAGSILRSLAASVAAFVARRWRALVGTRH